MNGSAPAPASRNAASPAYMKKPVTWPPKPHIQALKDAKISAEKIDLIIVATISPDSNFPSVACKVQKAIGAKKAAAFDVSAACSGYLYALTTAKQYIQTGLAKRALVIAAERITTLIDWKDRDTCVLFGDGAGACVLGPVKSGRHHR